MYKKQYFLISRKKVFWDLFQQTFVLIKTSWRSLEDVFRLGLQNTSWSRQIYSPYSYVLGRRLQDVRRLDQDQYICFGYKTSSRRLAKTFETSSRRLPKMFSRRFQNIFKTSSKNVFKTSSRRLAKMSSRHFQDVSSS